MLAVAESHQVAFESPFVEIFHFTCLKLSPKHLNNGEKKKEILYFVSSVGRDSLWLAIRSATMLISTG